MGGPRGTEAGASPRTGAGMSRRRAPWDAARPGLLVAAACALAACGGGSSLASDPTVAGAAGLERWGVRAIPSAAADSAGLPGAGRPNAAEGRSRGADASVRAVEDFLAAAARRDHSAMAARFGTARGPIADRGGALGCGLRRLGSWIGLGERCIEWRAVELRMDVIARLLSHASYRVVRSEDVAGRAAPSVLVQVELAPAGGRGGAAQVPFVVTKAADGRWLVAEVGLAALAG